MTGCVATAMAQIMYYHKWPESTTKEIPAFNYAVRYTNTPPTYDATPVTTLDWENMLQTYDENSTAEQKAAVATLMSVAGASVKMQFADIVNGGSTASDDDVAPALKEYFDYSATARMVMRGRYTYNDWTDLIYTELAAERPVFYSGQSSGGGHAFVVDGYDGEGYFHVNWGWGGLYNGYFLLSVLNPGGNDGAGASRSNDGYSFDQSAVIGIKKNEGESAPEGEIVPMRGEILSVTLNGGTGSIESSYWSALDGTYDMDFGIGYVTADGDFIPIAQSRFSNLSKGKGNEIPFTVSNLSSGTYHIVPICKLSTEEVWQSYINPECEYVNCVVEGGQVTELTHIHPGLYLSVESLNTASAPKATENITLEAVVSNTGATEFYGRLFLFASTTETKGEALTSGGVTILAGRSEETVFEFKLNEAGTYNVWVATDAEGNHVIGQTTLEVAAAAETSTNIDLGFAFEVSPASGTNIMSDHVTVTWTITNPSETDYEGQMPFYIWTWTGGNGSGTADVPTVRVPANSSTTWTKTYDLAYGGQYSFTAEYEKNGAITNNKAHIYDFYSVVHSTSYCEADCQLVFVEATATLDLPATATAVDLRGNTTTTAVTGGNANTIYFLDADAAVPSGVNGNIVRNGVANQIVITDGVDFGTPFSFVANNITYSRTFTTGLNKTGSSGWNTIVLPFSVSGVSVNNKPIDWFRTTDDTNKDFWLMGFESENGNRLNFVPVNELRAGLPYLIGVPDATWGDAMNLTEVPVSFTAQDVPISADFSSSSMAGDFKMKGTINSQTLSNIYVLNASGTAFERTSSGSVNPFQAYFAPTSASSSVYESLQIFTSDIATSIPGMNAAQPAQSVENMPWFDINGARVTQPNKRGIYVRGGQKIIVR